MRTDFDLLSLKEEVIRLEHETEQPNFWQNQDHARVVSQKLSDIKKEIAGIERFLQEVGSLRELVAMGGGDEAFKADIEKRTKEIEKEFRQNELSKLFSGPYDKGNAVMYIYAGAGGKDSEDWVAILRRMYERYAASKGYSAETAHENWGEFKGPGGQGLKNVTLILKGRPFIYGFLKKETGVHRLVRVSPFSAKNLRHTSFAMVEVMPEFVEPQEVELKPEDIEIDFFRSSGPGGQNVNKRETAVRITHKLTGIQVAVQTERTQERNRDTAMNMLRARLYQKKVSEQKKTEATVRGETVAAEWGHQIRSYVFHPYKLVKDHRTDVETSNVEAILEGELDEFIDAETRMNL
jgi:peptide chain release factor 2